MHWFRGRQPQLLGQRFAAVGVPVLRTEVQTLRYVPVGRPPLRWAQLVARVQRLAPVQWWWVRQAPELLPPQLLGWEGLLEGRCLALVWPG